jgi:succinyl-diaminopimelate desuccinylase
MNTEELIELTSALIARPSVTPNDAGCQELLAALLTKCAFKIRSMPFGDVTNLWATHGSGAPVLVFAGHTDVVPPGDPDAWESNPFEPSIRNGYLYGRGAADMKASLAAMLGAAREIAATTPKHPGTLAVLLTSDEEGPAIHGTKAVVSTLVSEAISMDYCVVGEPSSSERLGDVVRNGRRGSINGRIKIHGVMGHVAYPSLADNPIHHSVELLQRLLAIDWDAGNAFFPATSLQIANVTAGTGATNVIPGTWHADFNVRFNTEQTAKGIEQRVERALADLKCDWHIDWQLSGVPFVTKPGALLDAVTAAVQRRCGYAPELSTSGGTSDGRFIAPLGTEVAEIGPSNATIHKFNERVAIADLERLQDIYADIGARLLV